MPEKQEQTNSQLLYPTACREAVALNNSKNRPQRRHAAPTQHTALNNFKPARHGSPAPHDYGRASDRDNHSATMRVDANDEPTAQLTDVVGRSKPSATAVSSTIATSDSSEGMLNFFDLPRELRDKIYEQPVLFENQRLPSTEKGFFIKAKKLRTSLLLINRQFKREYSEQCEKQQALCFRDRPGGGTLKREKVTIKDKAERWNIDWCICEYSSFASEVDYLYEILSTCAPAFAMLGSVNIKLWVSDCTFAREDIAHIKEHVSRIPAFEKVAMLEVYRIRNLNHSKKASEPRELFARWHRKGNMPLEFMDSPVSEDGTESDWEAFPDEDFCDASCDDGAHESDGDTESIGSDDDEQDDGEDGHDNDNGDDISVNEPEEEGSASGKNDEKDSEDADKNDGTGKPGRMDEAVDVALESTTRYFDFFGLPRELRNMVYNQPAMLEEKTLRPPDSPYNAEDSFVRKPRSSLLLVNRQFCVEYRESCDGRVELYFSGNHFVTFDRSQVSRKVALEANILTLRFGGYCLPVRPGHCHRFDFLIPWIKKNRPLMPNLRSLTV